jgi:pimeloyl-ACP methyl ester carboxylesterase
VKIAHAHRTTQPVPQKDPSQAEYRELIAPKPDDRVEIGQDTAPVRELRSMTEAKNALSLLDYHPDIDPFVATVAGGIYAGKVSDPKDAQKISLELPKYYEREFEVELGLQHGPEAPLLVILPGIYGERDGGFNTLTKKTAHERGMNYLVIPNALGDDALDDGPKFHPGNPGLESEMVVDILKMMKERHPDHFDKVSITGYSYGGLLAANVVRADEEAHNEEQRLITGGMFAVSPPEDLYDSMRELDGLRLDYADGAGSVLGTVLKYRKDVKKFGYQNFPLSELAQRGKGENITEIKISDKYGSRNDMEDMVPRVDRMFGHNAIPRMNPLDPDTNRKRREMLDAMNYLWYSSDWFSKDSWLVARGLTPEAMADEYSYKNALNKIERTPALTLVSRDDYIINQDNVRTYEQLAAQNEPLEATKVLETGGHVGALFNPEVRGVLADFTFATAERPGDFKENP